VSASSRANPSTDAATVGPYGSRERVFGLSRSPLPRWSGYAWGAIATATTFIALTCWWLTQDRTIPIYDAGDQLETALEYHKLLEAGNLLGPFTHENVYPILGHMIGAIAALIGGVNVAAPIIGENVVFVSLLALGCYQTGRIVFGKPAGMLAVVFVFGSPLLMSLFHVFMLDAPLTAMVAVSVWLLLASEDFSRVGVSGLAGLAVGLGLNVKIQFSLFLIGLTTVVFLHGGWRNWRGFTLFAVVALLIGTPWYIEHSSELGRMIALASSGPGTPAGNIPPTFTTANLLWYFWSVLNSQLLAPLFILAVGGILWTFVSLLRSRGAPTARLEFFAGGFLAWLVITFPDSHHDIRYGLPLLAFLAVVATGWIVSLPRLARAGAIALLALGVVTNTLGITFGVGHEATLALTHPLPPTEQLPDRIVLYETNGFLASGPNRDGDIPGLLEALKREGVETVAWGVDQSSDPDFSQEGLKPLALIAGLATDAAESPPVVESATVATLLHEPTSARQARPCARLSDGTGVWVTRYDPAAGELALYCPSQRPRYYAVGSVG
jgi:4-amino-4-deoxy-L-arabinose transferase-like glycosyltransferase